MSGSNSSYIGLWCTCYQAVEGISNTPFNGKIIRDLGGRWELRVRSKTVIVNRGACSSKPWKRGVKK